MKIFIALSTATYLIGKKDLPKVANAIGFYIGKTVTSVVRMKNDIYDTHRNKEIIALHNEFTKGVEELAVIRNELAGASKMNNFKSRNKSIVHELYPTNSNSTPTAASTAASTSTTFNNLSTTLNDQPAKNLNQPAKNSNHSAKNANNSTMERLIKVQQYFDENEKDRFYTNKEEKAHGGSGLIAECIADSYIVRDKKN